ncbi:molybdopterin guanine dinucleotide biosynthesis accessory protein MobB [Hasllibacter halocynthiae]|uniref:Molybdopterin guanine dinucleotide biosynthesis accessory protein MobB n=1 Tax=Hasllibacter halocynthiae TaxID=595589 RepID=A0A2T0X3V2_9RHOB|nr:molybdopterin-guanine dinucleotide biosynthesis protein B [Hasllibacter halocynthiae]PRY93622.1 molybdopterin guanine dinucleotide biosynthesis accessory protein MobB [Hasllibacter halocynthiae]
MTRIVGVVGRKNGGKTGLVERLVGVLAARGLEVATMKNAHHDARLDVPGTDSDRHRRAGAARVLLATPEGWAMTGGAPEGPEALARRLAGADVVLAEGFKAAPWPKIEAWRPECREGPLAPAHGIAAVASTGAPQVPLPVLPLDDTEALAGFALKLAVRLL